MPASSPSSSHNRLPVLALVLLLAMAAGGTAWIIQDRWGHLGAGSVPHPADDPRIVSLSPAVTEVMFALGVQSELVAVSDYCVIPEGDSTLVRAGTALTPNYEALARLRPSRILAEESKQAPVDNLQAIAPTEMLAWLTIDDLVAGIERIGVLTDRAEEARQLANRVRRKLDVPSPPGGPRVLLTMAHSPGQLSECWFIRDNSIHGRALRAAGARNAVPEEIHGVPRIGLERVIDLDPDAILILSPDGHLAPEARRMLIDDWKKITPLRAALDDRIAVVAGDSLYFTGPATMRLADRLRETLASLPGNGR